MPDKAAESATYPVITHAHCTVQRANAPYMARYIEQRILTIPPEEIAESHAKGYPTVLICGPPQFTRRIADYLSKHFSSVDHKQSAPAVVEPIDGYRRIAVHPDSRLGWRILLYAFQPPETNEILRRALIDGEELSAILPEHFRAEHLRVAGLVGQLQSGQALTPEDVEMLEAALGVPLAQFRVDLGLVAVEAPVSSASDSEPTIVVTSLVEAKGLQCGHAFVVGVNEGHFPRSNGHITDEEVCSLLVALTRAKKSCTLVSCDHFGKERLGQSLFVDWLRPHLASVRVDQGFFGGR